MTKMELNFSFVHKSNWSDETLRAARSSKFHCALISIIRKIPLLKPGDAFTGLGQEGKPSYTVMITDTEAAAKRAADAKSRREKRMDFVKADSAAPHTPETEKPVPSIPIEVLDADNVAEIEAARAEAAAAKRKAEIEKREKAEAAAKAVREREEEQKALEAIASVPASPALGVPERERAGSGSGNGPHGMSFLRRVSTEVRGLRKGSASAARGREGGSPY
jgi:hypothetical protein